MKPLTKKNQRTIKKTKRNRKRKSNKSKKHVRFAELQSNTSGSDNSNSDNRDMDLYKGMVKLNCSPISKLKSKHVSGTSEDFTCLSNDAIYQLKELWNQRHPDDLITSDNKKNIWIFLKEKMKHSCNKESCWLKQKFVDGKLDKELDYSFSPESPDDWKKNPNEWLSSNDIIDVMRQYEEAYKCFEFLGPSPIDYDVRKMYGECVWQELCQFNLEEQIKKGKTKVGIIFNLDPHTKDGSHWVSLFINIKRKMIFYFDSAGFKIPKQIMKFVNTVISQGNSLKKPIHFIFDQNHPVEHQYGNTECGMYSLYFIVHMLEDKINSYYLKNHIIKDEDIEKFREIYFNPDL